MIEGAEVEEDIVRPFLALHMRLAGIFTTRYCHHTAILSSI